MNDKLTDKSKEINELKKIIADFVLKHDLPVIFAVADTASAHNQPRVEVMLHSYCSGTLLRMLSFVLDDAGKYARMFEEDDDVNGIGLEKTGGAMTH